jgi:hypothetical protein
VTTPIGAHFLDSYDASRGPGSASLAEDSAKWQEMAQAGLGKPTSVLQQLSPSPIAANLSAPSQRERLLPNGFTLSNTSNGAAEPTAQADNYLKMSGQQL